MRHTILFFALFLCSLSAQGQLTQTLETPVLTGARITFVPPPQSKDKIAAATHISGVTWWFYEGKIQSMRPFSPPPQLLAQAEQAPTISAAGLQLPTHRQKQRYRFRPVMYVGVGAAFISGAAWGLHEKTAHHWPEFNRRFPNANPQTWNPDMSWRNKYPGGNPANGRVMWGPIAKPVHLTDAKHALASMALGGMLVSGVCITIGEKRPWWHYALDAGAIMAAQSFGNYLTWEGVYRWTN